MEISNKQLKDQNLNLQKEINDFIEESSAENKTLQNNINKRDLDNRILAKEVAELKKQIEILHENYQ